MNTMLFEYVEPLRLMILVHGERAPTDAEWDPYVAMLRAKWALDRPLRRVFVYGDGPGPNASQRQKLRYEPRDDRPISTAVITHSLVARGIVTALSWFFEIRAFSPGSIDDSFEYLEVPRSEWLMVRTAIATMRMRLTGTRSIDEKVELSDSIATLDELITERLPKLRARVQRARGAGGLR
jgi:hypothetical protein